MNNNPVSSYFGTIAQTRANLINLISSLDLEAINKIPSPIKNNIAWNFGHIIATQGVLCYQLSGLPIPLEADFVARYRKGTSPTQDITAQELEQMKELAVGSLEQLRKDYDAGIFKEFTVYTTSYGIELRNIEDAIYFNSVHEGMHLGYAMAINRLVRK